ncbi:hypothetical protein ACWOAQ_04260 [Helcococcus kunzii]|uniref:Lipoprotein n=1 Tax=Helcococcus kunzii ATCC 51366 TaxID=883114 RepID=H3NMZ9_9FIRM|nr:hypothetical protein [Helcococcus kunzii]EHR34403.1 hypothetical protein HMPREF9709_00710 [Helcococcus kunzii ATCC 51366]QUY64646.1 hypothetical protein GUI37_03645 [Helcococcus kunzii]QZO77061.1 hypothetical protein HIF96_03310 [Helcococcus kunzii]
MKIKALLLSIAVLLLVGCNQKQNNETETKPESNIETKTEVNKENDTKDEDDIANKKINFKSSDLKINEYKFADGTTEQEKKEYTSTMNELFPYGVEWQVKLYNDEISADEYKWSEETIKDLKSTNEQLHKKISEIISYLKSEGFYPNLNSSTCQIFVNENEIQGVVVYTTWISDTDKTVNNFEVHIAPDKSIIVAGIKSVE